MKDVLVVYYIKSYQNFWYISFPWWLRGLLIMTWIPQSLEINDSSTYQQWTMSIPYWHTESTDFAVNLVQSLPWSPLFCLLNIPKPLIPTWHSSASKCLYFTYSALLFSGASLIWYQKQYYRPPSYTDSPFSSWPSPRPTRSTLWQLNLGDGQPE